jgi:hypothetical protein
VPATRLTRVVDRLKVLALITLTKYLVLADTPVGRAPVVVNITELPVTIPCEVQVTTPGVAIVIVAVALAHSSDSRVSVPLLS